MSAASSKLAVPRTPSAAATTLRDLILIRAAASGGATRAEIANDLAPLVTHKLPLADWRRVAERETGELVAAGLATETRNRITVTGSGAAAAARHLGRPADLSWPELRDGALVAKALGLEREPPARLKLLARPDALRALLVQRAFGLPLRKNEPPAKLRAKLAVVALERAFGNRIKAGFGKASALSAKAGRLLAGQLSKNPRSFPTDAKLIAELATEAVGAAGTDIDALRAAILRGLGARALESTRLDPAPASRVEKITGLDQHWPRPANDAAPAALAEAPPVRPDLDEFARSVKSAAADHAEGWPGSRKAYISHVWQAIRAAKPAWQLSEIEFKCMLAEAHRRGAVMLANADLKSKGNMKEIESSAVLYKNSVWHFVRVEE